MTDYCPLAWCLKKAGYPSPKGLVCSAGEAVRWLKISWTAAEQIITLWDSGRHEAAIALAKEAGLTNLLEGFA